MADGGTTSLRSPLFNPDPTLYADPVGRAARMLRFVRRLKLWEGDAAGQAFPVKAFQEAITLRIYGPATPDGKPLVRTAALWLPRGNAKTTLAAAYALGHHIGPEAVAGGQVVTAAADAENAGIAFRSAFEMVKQDRVLMDRVQPIESRKILRHPRTRGTFKAISTEAYSKHGLNVSFFLADEVHAWPPVEARKLFKVVTDSMVKRKHPLTIIISTAGEGQGGLAWDLWRYSHRVAAGEIDDPTFAPIIFAADSGADWRDERVWTDCNPALACGFANIQELRTKAKRLEHFPADVADFKRFHLNIWTEGAVTPWVDLSLYDQAEPLTPVDELRGRRCYVGVDLSSVEDLTAAVAVFPDEDGEDPGYDVLAMFFLPEANIDRKSEQDRADYIRWADEGHLILTPGNVVDQEMVIDYVAGLADLYDVAEVPIDRYNATAAMTALQKRGLTVAQFGQGFLSMAAPVRELKRAILKRKFRHGGNPLLRLCFGNVVVDKDAAENEKFTKERARGRIDGAVGAAMGIGRALANAGAVSIFDRPELWAATKATAPATGDDGSWDPEILKDMTHPLFAEHKRRFEDWQDTHSAEDD